MHPCYKTHNHRNACWQRYRGAYYSTSVIRDLNRKVVDQNAGRKSRWEKTEANMDRRYQRLVKSNTGWPENGTISCTHDFHNYFTIRIGRKFLIVLSLKTHLECVATLPCEMSSVCRSVSLIVPLVSGVAVLSGSSSSKTDTHLM